MSENILDSYEAASCFDNVKKSRGRPIKVLNKTGAKVIEALAQVMCTEEEIAACLGVSVETLKTENNKELFSECLKKGRDVGKMSLRRAQFRIAQANPTMAIWLGKQYLGQTEKPVPEEDNEFNDTPATIEVIVEDASGGDDE